MAVSNPEVGRTYYLAGPTASGEYGVFGVVVTEVFPLSRSGLYVMARRATDNAAGLHWCQDAEGLYDTLDAAAAAAAVVNSHRRLDRASK